MRALAGVRNVELDMACWLALVGPFEVDEDFGFSNELPGQTPKRLWV
jgi:hypothetical protein